MEHVTECRAFVTCSWSTEGTCLHGHAAYRGDVPAVALLGLRTALEAHEWFIEMMHELEEFEVETDRAGEWPVPFVSETVSRCCGGASRFATKARQS